MAKHYCVEHKTAFFMKGAMRGYAHPIEGSDPTEWCNEPEDGGDETPTLEEEAKNMGAVEVGQPNPKNRAFALSYAKDLCVADKIVLADIGAYAKKFAKYLDTGE